MTAGTGHNFDLKEEIRAYWSKQAPTFDDCASHQIEDRFGKPEWQTFLRKAAGLEPTANMSGLKVLDLACGTGEISRMLCSLGAEVTGLDFSEDMLKASKTKLEGHNWSPLMCDAEHLVMIPDETYDFAVTRHLAWTLTRPGAAYAEWFRVLRPGGRILINDGNWARPYSRSHRFKRFVANWISPQTQRTDADRTSDASIRMRLPYAKGLTSASLQKDMREAGCNFVEALDLSPLYGRGMRAWPLATRLRQTSENRFALVFQRPSDDAP